jgi:hypothetical protein
MISTGGCGRWVDNLWMGCEPKNDRSHTQPIHSQSTDRGFLVSWFVSNDLLPIVHSIHRHVLLLV